MNSQVWKSLATVVVLAAIVTLALAIETLRLSRPVLVGRLCLGLALVSIVALMLLVSLHLAHAHDHANPAQNEWYQSLMQPDNPTMSCCGEADAYWADDVHVRGGKTYVTITDDRDDGPLKRPHIPNGTEIEVPNHKLKWNRGNPTGHGVIFLSPQPYNFVYCYVQPGGA